MATATSHLVLRRTPTAMLSSSGKPVRPIFPLLTVAEISGRPTIKITPPEPSALWRSYIATARRWTILATSTGPRARTRCASRSTHPAADHRSHAKRTSSARPTATSTPVFRLLITLSRASSLRRPHKVSRPFWSSTRTGSRSTMRLFLAVRETG
jgi:hypothetical protein